MYACLATDRQGQSLTTASARASLTRIYSWPGTAHEPARFLDGQAQRDNGFSSGPSCSRHMVSDTETYPESNFLFYPFYKNFFTDGS
jgi:hypothetical protein